MKIMKIMKILIFFRNARRNAQAVPRQGERRKRENYTLAANHRETYKSLKTIQIIKNNKKHTKTYNNIKIMKIMNSHENQLKFNLYDFKDFNDVLYFVFPVCYIFSIQCRD